MPTSSRGSGALIPALLLLLLAGADAFVFHHLMQAGPAALLASIGETLATTGAGPALQQALDGGLLPWLAVPILGPLLVAVVALLTGRRGSVAAPVVAEDDAAPAIGEEAPAAPSPDVALRLLATLQEEARLIDFVREDIDGYDDADVGSAVRGIHAALRKAIDERLTVEPILAGEDGDRVEVPAGFEPALIRVTGKLGGGPPYVGVLRHGGWRARDVRLPAPSPGSDATILLPAEVEVGAE
jgi:hypothetical protein